MSAGDAVRLALLTQGPLLHLRSADEDRVLELLVDLQRQQGTTLVLVTHDERLAERCDRRFSMTAGELSGP